MIDDLKTGALANAAHEASDPLTRLRLCKRNAAPLQQREHELEMLQLFDGDRVEFIDALEKLAIFFERDRSGRGLAFEMRVIDENRRQIGQHFRQPISRNFFAE